MGEQVVGRVASGLGMAMEPEMDFLKKIVKVYDHLNFELNEDSSKQVTVVQRVTDILLESGYDPHLGKIQKVCGITIYPPDYFNPQDFQTGAITLTDNTRTIHHFAESWKPPIEQKLHTLGITWYQKYGESGRKTAYIVGLPYWVYKKFKVSGIDGITKTVKKKVRKTHNE